MIRLLGRTPRDRGQLYAVGGNDPEEIPPSDSPQTPAEPSVDAIRHRSGGSSSKRITREYFVDSPRKKSSKTHSIDETLESLSNVIKRAELWQEERHDKRKEKRQNMYREEMAQVKQILAEDGIEENDEVFMKVVNLCYDETRHQSFLDLNTKEGRLKWVEVSWAFTEMTKK
jgi:hypothetical protein